MTARSRHFQALLALGALALAGAALPARVEQTSSPLEPVAEWQREGHPHPLTQEHERLRRERALLAELDQAIDFRDGAALRAGLAAYRREFPEDPQGLQQGYAVLASCLTNPGPASRVDAERFYRTRHGSSLRRWIRRVCLEP